MKIILSLVFFAATFGPTFGQLDALRKQHFNVKKNVAIEGYDPVSYFEGKPLAGDPEIKLVYKNITYQFASTSNLAKFKLDPEKYEPAYGGWCA